MKRRKVLVIEDDQDIAHVVALHLRDVHCDVSIAHDGDSGLAYATSRPYDLIILDLMLPGVTGLDICQRVRTGPSYTPILMLTAKSSELDRVLGLEMGADDYLTKPFSILELLARVKALFRRVQALQAAAHTDPQHTIRILDLQIEVAKRRVLLAGQCVNVTTKEFDLLLQFAQHPGRVYTRAQLLDQVWGYGHEGYEHTVNSHINRLRAKIERDPRRPHYILTVWGVGYKFVDAADQVPE
jgi:DNA-binding response OmpR family regulator